MSPKVLSGLAAALLIASSPASAQEQITKAQLAEMFSNIESQTGWDLDGPLVWGYFFTGEEARLALVAVELERSGYRVVETQPVDRTIWRLHVEKVEHHDVESLSARNAEFYEMARRHRLSSYDGMDVGPVLATER